MLLYDLTDMESVERLKWWVDHARQDDPYLPIVLVGMDFLFFFCLLFFYLYFLVILVLIFYTLRSLRLNVKLLLIVGSKADLVENNGEDSPTFLAAQDIAQGNTTPF
jgi:hypothetical protein